MSLLAPGLSARIKGFPNRKPERLLPFYPSLVAPEWAWVWDSPNLLVAYALWEGGGNTVYNLSKNLVEGVKIAGISFPLWASNRAGLALDFTSSDRAIGINKESLLLLPGECSIIAYGQWNDLAATQQIVANANSAGFAQEYGFELGRTDNRLSWVHGNTVAGASDTNILAGSTHLLAANRVGSGSSWTIDYFLDGVPDGSQTLSVAPDAHQVTAIGRLGAFNGQYLNAILSYVFIFNAALGAERHAQLGLDPSGPFRTRSLPLFLPSVADALDIASMLSPIPRWDSKVRFY